MSKFRISLIFPIVFISVVVALFSFSVQDVWAITETLKPESRYLNMNISYVNSNEVDAVQTNDGDSSFIFAKRDKQWQGQLYSLTNHTGSGVINSVTVYVVAKDYKDRGAQVKTIIYTHDQDYSSSAFSLPSSYTTKSSAYTTNPYTGSSWTWQEIDDLAAGAWLYNYDYKYTYCTQIYVTVDYSPPIITPSTVTTVTTDIATISSIQLQNNQATLKGNITNTGGENPSQRVLEWGTSSGSYTNSYNCGSGGTGEFSHTISLTPGTIYYYRAKAFNSGGWGYGTEKRVVIYQASGGQKSFTTPAVTYTLTVSKAGTGSGKANFNPPNTDFTLPHSETYNSGTSVVLTAKPDAGSTFAGWSGACSGTGTCIVTMTANRSVTATFHKLQYTLTGTITGTGSGTVNVNPPNVNYTSSFTRTYNSGTSVTLTATPAAGSYFAGWSGVCSGTGTCAVTMNANKNVTATFNLSDAVPPTTGIKIIRTATGEDVTTAGVWLRLDTYTIQFEDHDQAAGSGSNCENCSCEYSVYSCDAGGTNCNTQVVPPTSRTPNSSFDIVAGKTAPTYNLEGVGRYLIQSVAKDMANNSTTTYRGINLDFTPPRTEIK